MRPIIKNIRNPPKSNESKSRLSRNLPIRKLAIKLAKIPMRIRVKILFTAQAASIERLFQFPIHGLTELPHTQIVTQDFAERLIYLCRERSTPQALTKLRLDHVERRFDIGPLVIVL